MNQKDHLGDALQQIGLSLRTIEASAESVILFGSRSANVSRKGSDWDVLCIGCGKSRKTPVADVLWIKPKRILTSSWRRSELAGHIAVYGTTVFGDSSWMSTIVPSDHAALRKAERLSKRIKLVSDSWDKLNPVFQQKHWRLLSYDMARLASLAAHIPVPPTPMLDVSNQAVRSIAIAQAAAGLIEQASRDDFLKMSDAALDSSESSQCR